ncbi:MAG: ribokinase [Acidimicrobiia bacterium]
MDIEIAVVGSLNYDLTVVARRHPRPGETVLGSSHYSACGGKGANQAVAAARLGSLVGIIGRVGEDDHGAHLTASLESEAIDTTGITVDRKLPTGLAVITIDADAENTIVVDPGANMNLGVTHVRNNASAIAGARVLLMQFEVPMEAVMAASQLAKGLVCVNPAPAIELSKDLLSRVDVLIPNRSELGLLAGGPEPKTLEEVRDAAATLNPDMAIVVTLGAQGAAICHKRRFDHFPAPGVTPVDPTGSGDAFCGALAHGLSSGQNLQDATSTAVIAGAIAATRRGAQDSMPTWTDIDGFAPRG